MDHTAAIINVIIILISAVLVVGLFRRLKISSIVGYLIAGLAIGPHAFGFITDLSSIQILAELGVVFLLFTIGLKMPMRRLQVLKRYVFGFGLLQVVITSSVIGLLASFFNFSAASSFLIASALALSSTAVGLQLLTEQGELAQKFGRVSFAILLFQDLAVVLLLVLLTNLSSPDQSLVLALSAAALKAVIVLILIILFGRLILRPLFRAIAPLQNAEIFTALSILTVLLTSLATDAAGLSKELGAFLAGLLLTETEYRHQVEADIQPFYGLLLGLFFMTIGMSINLSIIIEQLGLILGLLASVLVLKSLIILGLCALFKIPAATGIRVAMVLAAGGEFAFVLLGPAVQQNLLSPDVAQALYLTVAISMALTPFLTNFGKFLSEKILCKDGDATITASQGDIDDLRNHVIIAGYGRLGKMIAQLLITRMIPFVVIDNDMNRVLDGRSRGLPVYYGDAMRDMVWKSLGADKAAAAVVGLGLPKSTLKTTLMVRRKFPHINVSVRVNDDMYEDKLTQAGATVVKPENFEPSLHLASLVLKSVGTNENEISQIIENFRRNYQAQMPTTPSPAVSLEAVEAARV
jgi:CPA2 family monovalent cation:H+ antiporter-2